MTYWKENEKIVLDLLNDFDGSDFRLSDEEKSIYDIIGTSEGVKTLVEVKYRNRKWNEMWIDKSKLEGLFKFGKDNTSEEFNVYIVVSAEGKHYLYNAKDIWTKGTHKKEKMNHKTDFLSNGKMNKDIVEFTWDTYMVELVSKELGKSYERL